MKQLIRLSLLILMLTFGIKASYSQMAGDYRSSGSGNWNALSTWQRYNGTDWTTPTTEGWPGQFTGTGAVTIQYGNTITISNTGITTLPMGTLTVSGTLYLMGTSSNATDFNINSQIVIVTPNLAIKAKIWFMDKANLILPPSATIFVGNDITDKGLDGNCSNQQTIYFGSVQFYACQGGGGECGTFEDLMINGGNPSLVLTSGAGTNNPTICENSPFNITYSVSGGATGVDVVWLPSSPAGVTDNYNSGIYTISGTPTVAGNYSYTITTKSPCTKATATGTITVEPKPNILATVTSTNVTFFGANDGTIAITDPTGGSGNYEYTIDGGTTWQTNQNFTGLIPDTYNIQIRDKDHLACVLILNNTLVITQPNALTATFVSTDATCSGTNDGTITISAPTGGSGNFEYTINGGISWQTNGNYTGLAPATYDIQIRDKDQPSSSVVLNSGLVITQPSVLMANVTPSNVTLCGVNDGKISFTTPSGGSSDYEYSIDGSKNWQANENFTGLKATTYNIQIRDKNHPTCLVILNSAVVISQPISLSATVMSSNVSFCGANDGIISISSAAGGSGNYDYTIDGGTIWQSGENFTGLMPATYNIQIRDRDFPDCILLLNSALDISQPNDLIAGIISSNVTFCGANDGTISITTPTGGSGDYEYTIDGGTTWQADQNFKNLIPKNYNVQIRDKLHPYCVSSLNNSLSVIQPNDLTATVISANVTCTGANDGTITITSPIGGSGIYEYSIDGGSSWQSNGVYIGRAPAQYNVQIRDKNHPLCVTILNDALVITQPNVLKATLVSTDVNCNGTNDGSITISTPTGGSGDYEYSIDGGASWQENESYYALAPSTYNVQIRDKNHPTCVLILNNSLVINQPIALAATLVSTDVTCNGANNGTVTISSPTGGSGNYEYTIDGWSTWQANQNFTGLAPATYNIQIRDKDHKVCILILNNALVITQPNALAAILASTDVTCSGANDGTITISAPTGGSGNYEYTIDGGTIWQTNQNFTGLVSATYNVQIRDKDHMACFLILNSSLVINQPNILTGIVINTNVTCNGANDGTITISAPTGGSGNYEYSIDGGYTWQTNGVYTGRAPVSYNVQVRDQNQPLCVAILNNALVITQPNLLTATLVSTDVTCSGTNDGTITISAPTGGSGNFEYTIDGWTTWQTNGNYTGLAPATYNVQIRDKDQPTCFLVLNSTLMIAQPNALTATLLSTDVTCNGANDATITISAPTGGSGNYEYTIDGWLTWQANQNFTGLKPDTYNTQIRDKDHPACVLILNNALVIAQPNVLNATLASSDVTCNGANDGTITISAPTGGSGNYEYTIDGGTIWQVNQNFTALASATYNVQIRDKDHPACALILNSTLVVAQPNLLSLTSISSNAPICEGSTINLNVSIAGGTPNYTYDWTGPNSFASNSQNPVILNAISVASGTYSLTVKDKNGCVTSSNLVVVVQPIPTITASSLAQNICSGTAPAITLTGSVSGTTFNWTVIQSDVSGAADAGGAAINQVLTATGTSPGSATYKVTPSANGCDGSPLVIVITAIPSPIASASALAQTICSGSAPAITLTSSLPNTIFNWTVAETDETGATDDNGNTIDQTLATTGTTTGTATYTITPTASGCTGSPITVVITVDPIPTATVTPLPETICTGSTTSINLASDVSGTTFNWTAAESDVTGTSAGSGTTIAQTLTATTASFGTATYTITPKFNGCVGAEVPAIANVNPIPTVTPSSFAETICSGSAPAITLDETVLGTTFNWTVVQSANVSGASDGNGPIIAQTLTTTGTTPGTATYTVTPTADGCDGIPVDVKVTVNPMPVLSSSLIENACSDIAFTYVPTSNTPGALFNWSRVSVVGIQNPNASGTGTVTESLDNITGTAKTVTYVFTVTDNVCTSPFYNVEVTVYPKPSLISSLTPPAVCSNTLFNYTPVPSIAGTTLTWSRAVVAGISNPAGNGSGDINETLINTTAADVIVPYVYTLINGCNTTVIVNVTIKPTPVLSSAITALAICNNSVFSYVPASLTPGTTFNWTRTPVSGISNGFNFDSGNVSETLINITDSPLNVSYTYTLKANGCENEQDVTVAVNPTATVDDQADQQFCNGVSTPVIQLTGLMSSASFNWTNDNPAIGLAAGGLGDIPSFTATNNTGVPISALIKVTPSANGCDGDSKTFHISVEPSPLSNIPVDQVICNGVSTTTINFSGTFDHVTWTNDHPEIGLAANGSGNIGAFTGTNPGSDPIIAKITVTAHPAISGSGCDGIPFSFSITVNPSPIVDAIGNQTFCAGSNNSGCVFLTSTTGGSPTFNWTSSTDIGFGTSGSGSIPSFTANNGGSSPLTATVNVTATINGCTGNSTTFAITVNPAPTVDLPSDQAFCNTATTTAVHFTGTATSFSWTNSNNAIGLASSGTGDLPYFTAINMGTVPIIAIVTVTPTYINGGKTCTGPTKSFNITVNPSPTGTISGTTISCQGGAEPLITFTGANGTYPYTFTYKINGGADQSVSTTSGNSVTVSAPITVTGTFNYNLVKVVTGDGCSQLQSGSATINVVSKPGATISGTTAICQNGATPVVTFTGSGGTAPYIFTYQVNGGAPQTVTTISGNSALLNVPTAAPGIFVYSLISVSSASGCTQPQTGAETITVNSPPILVINNPGAVCSPLTVDLTSPAITSGSTVGLAYAYWTDPSANTSFGTPATAGNGTYYIKGTDPATGCFVIKSVSATVNTTPTLLITNPSPVCAPSRVDLTSNAVKAGSTAGLNYTYWTDATATIPYATPATADDDTYYIKGTSLTGCYAIKPVTASIYATIGIPVFALGSSSVICQGSAPVTYSATVAQAFTLKYSIDATSFASGNTIDTNTGKVTFAPGWVGTSQITATATGCGAPSTAIHTVKVNPSPSVSLTVSPATAVCEGTSVTLTATNSGGAETQNFSGSSGNVNLTIPDWTNTTFANSSITLAGSNGAILAPTDVVMVTLNITHGSDQELDIFLVDPTGTKAMLLSSDNGSTNNNYTNTVFRTDAVNPIIGGTPPFTGTYLPEGTITTISDRTDAAGGNYNSVIPANALNGAPIDGSWSLRVFDDKKNTTGILNNWSLSISKQIGVGYTSVVNGPPTIGAVNYAAADHKTATAVVTPPAGTNIYTVTTTNGIGCSTTSNPVSVVIKPTPIPTITADYCIARPKVRLTASSHASWLWNTGATAQTIDADVAGTYTVTVKDAAGCTGTTSIQVADEKVTDGSFTNFNATTPSFHTEYTQNQPYYNGGSSQGLYPEGYYAVNTGAYYNGTTNLNGYHGSFHGRDHTNNTTGARNFLMVNGSSVTVADPDPKYAGPPSNGKRAKIIWQQTITVEPGMPYYFSAWGMNLNPSSPARLRFEVNGVPVGIIAELSLAPAPTTEAGVNLSNWIRFYSNPNWIPAAGVTTAVIRIINLNTDPGGNDFGIDDISFATLGNVPLAIGTSNNSPVSSPICSRGTLELSSTVTGGKPVFDYTWTGPNGYTSKDANPVISNVSPYAAGIYTLAVKDWYNCPAITSTTTVALNPTPEIPDQSALICSGSPFDATPKDGVPDASTYVKTGTTYSWPAPMLSPAGSITGASAGSGLIAITQTLTNTTTSPATATYTVTPVHGTCTGNPFKVVVTVNPTATVNAGINQDICVGSAVQLNGSIGGAATSASWSGGTGSFTPNRNSLTPVYTPSAAEITAGTVTLNLNSNDPDGAGPCSAATASVTIAINSLPTLAYSSVNLNCSGASNGSITLFVSSGTPVYSYTWTASNGGSVPSGQVNAQSLTNLVAGTYSVIVNDSKNCGANKSIPLTEPTALVASESHLNVSCAGQVASVIITATGGKTPYSGTGTFSQSVGTTTYAITDANGCTASVTANVTANPNTAPVITTNPVTRNFNGCTPAAITAPAFSSTIAGSTYSEFSDSNNKGVATDNCAITTVSYQDVANASCPITVTRTWTLGDASGLTTTCQQVLKVTDIDKPTWTTAAGLLNKTVDCSDATGKANALALFPTAGDVCDPTVSNIGKPIKTSGVFVPAAGCSQSGTYTNSWKVTDACGNTSDAYIQVIILTDNTSPAWITPAGSLDRTLQCSDNVGLTSAKALKPVATDNCDGNVTNLVKVTGAFVSGGTCGQQGTYTNSWTVKDDCGNLSTVFKQVITLTDNTAPIWITAPGAINATVECDDVNGLAAAQALHPKAWDNCDINVSNLVKTSGLLVPSGAGSNEGTYTNTWVVKDDCGNTSPIYTQTITVEDNTAPIIYCPPCNAFSCNSPSFDPAVTGTATATDHCDSAPVISYSDNIVTTSCAGEYKIIRTWTAKDARGNSSSCQQTIFVQDVTPPVLNVPSDRTVDYHNPTTPSSTGTATASDNCDANPIVSYTDQTISGATIHDYTIVRTWLSVDCANNTSSFDQKITVKDFTALSITCQPAVTANTDLNQSWASNINPGIPTLTGSGVTYSWSMSGVTVGAGNGAMGKRRFNLGITTITWKAKNYSGTTTCTQTVTVLDKQPPTFSVTAASFVQCVEKLETAIYNIPTTDINPDRPDYYSLDNGSTLLNLNTATFSDNCSLSKCTVEIRWKIDLSDGTRIPDLSTPYNTGQPSTYGMNIKLTGDGINFSTLTHTITYWIVDCAGNVSLPKTRTIIIKPRPKLTKGNN